MRIWTRKKRKHIELSEIEEVKGKAANNVSRYLDPELHFSSLLLETEGSVEWI
jgi:hypothetical protein